MERLLTVHTTWDRYLDRSAKTPRFIVPTEHPSLAAPLTIQLGGTLALHWHGGYFCDFLGLSANAADEASEFIERFLSEKVCCTLCWKNGNVVAGGPIETGERLDADGFDRIEIRSWRGTYESDVFPAS